MLLQTNMPVNTIRGMLHKNVKCSYEDEIAKISIKRNDKLSLVFHKLCYTVEEKRFLPTAAEKQTCAELPKNLCKTTKKFILNKVSGVFKTGMNAIMGQSGSGKSSLLDVLAGRKNPKYITGTVLVNEQPQPKDFKCISGYVVQDDIVMGSLTVRENLQFSAGLRLPGGYSNKAGQQKLVENLIDELGLRHVADTPVGSEVTRGISGGERKRCCIGMELILSPNFLFLDEPTTGLDATTALSVMKLLKTLSLNRVVVFSIHQPRYSILKLFDNTTLMCNGEVVYHGPQTDIIPYFAQMGYVCETYNNPMDFVMDVVNGDIENKHDAKNISLDNKSNEQLRKRKSSLIETYKDSKYHKETLAEIIPILSFIESSATSRDCNSMMGVTNYKTSFCNQFFFLSKRFGVNLFRGHYLTFQIGMKLMHAIIAGGLFYDCTKEGDIGLQNILGALFLVTMLMLLGNMAAINVFMEERTLLVHEHSSGYYRISAYFLSKFLCDIIPVRTLPTIPFCLLSYFLIGFKINATKFFNYTLANMLINLTGCCMCMIISASFRNFDYAQSILGVIFMVMMVFGGMLVNLKTMTKFLSWIRHFSIFRYGFAFLCINQIKDTQFCFGPKRNITGNTTKVGFFEEALSSQNAPCRMYMGNDWLKNQGFEFEDTWDIWQNIFILGASAIVMLLISFIQLRRINFYK